MSILKNAPLVLIAGALAVACSKPEPEPPAAAAPEAPAAEAPAEPEAPAPEPEAPAPAAAPDTMRVVAPDAMQWQKMENGVEVVQLFQDAETTRTAMLMKAPAGWSQGLHYHPASFHRLMLEGELEVTMADGKKLVTKKGDYVRGQANVPHSSKCNADCTLFLVTDGAFATVALGEDGKPASADDPAPGEVTGDTVHVAADARQWQELPGVEGVKMAVVGKNEETGATALFAQFDAGFDSGLHTHPSSFHRITVEGGLAVTPKDGEPMGGQQGEYFRGIGGVVHGGGSKEGGTIFVVSDGAWGTTFVDESGNPKPPAAAAE